LQYFDHTATKLIEKDVIEFYLKQLKANNYNPAAIYASGLEAAESISNSAKSIAKNLECEPDEIIFTSGATESINTAIKGIVLSPNPKTKRILTSAGEHSATTETLKFLEQKMDYQIDVCDLDANGQINLDQLERYLKNEKYDLLTIIHVNNVLGTINPIEKIVALRNQYQKELPIHLDSVQTLGKLELNLSKLGIELASFSLHKIGTPKGIGLLYKSRNTRIEPLIHGGGQQNSLRSGTENPALVATAAYVIEKTTKFLTEDLAKINKLSNYLTSQLDQAKINYQYIPSNDAEVVPHINAILFPNLRAETLLNVLNIKDIAVSIGSACSNKKSKQNEILKKLQLPGQMDKHILRISLASNNTKEEINDLVTKISEALAKYAV